MTKPRLLAVLLFAGIATLWVPGRWAYAALQVTLLLAASVSIVRNGWQGTPLIYALCAATVWGLVQLAAGTTVYARATLEKTLDWAVWLASAYLASSVYRNREAAARFARWLAVFGGALASAALVIRYAFHTSWMGPFAYDNQYAAFVALALAPAVVAVLGTRKRTVAAVLAAIMIGSVVISGSVAGAVIVVVEPVVVLALLRWRTGLSLRHAGAAMAVLAALVAVVGAIAGWQALEKDLHREAPLELRRLLTKATLEMAAARPWTGYGLGTWSTVYPAYAAFDDGVFDNQAHNDWAQWLAEGGVPFFAIMLAIAASIMMGAWRNPWGVGVLFVLAHCLIEYHFQQRPGFGCLFFGLAGSICVRHQREAG
jgi:O-antigen ligase